MNKLTFLIYHFALHFGLVYVTILGIVYLFSRKSHNAEKFSLFNIWAFIGALGNSVFRLLDKLS